MFKEIVCNLLFFIKVATERLKTDDEIVAEEKERLEKLEADRVRRMRGDVPEASPDDGDKARNSIEQLMRILSPFWNVSTFLTT